jgi:dCTP deaminase
MSILSDRQIRARCLMPTHLVVGGHQRFWFHVDGDTAYGLSHGEKVDLKDQKMAFWAQNLQPLTKEQIAGYCARYPRMITPYELELVRTRTNPTMPLLEAPIDSVTGQLEEKVISYGTSSYGYDVRCADDFKIFTNINSTVVDPKNFDDKTFVDFKGPVCIIPPNSFALARTVERFKIPRDVLTVCLGKSTYARCGIIVNVTPFEPEWEGYVTLEFSNTTPLPAKIYANEGVAQILFFKADEVCETSYADRGGKYQGQAAEVVCPKV